METGFLFGCSRLGGYRYSVLAHDAKQHHIKTGNHSQVFQFFYHPYQYPGGALFHFAGFQNIKVAE